LWEGAPVFGSGLGVFMTRSPEWLGHAQVIHSTPLWILAEFGLLGLAVFGGAFFVFARGAWKGRGNLPASGALMMLLGVFAVFCVAHEIFYQRLFWLVLGVLLAKPFGHRETT
jgi:O-antigen ligase